MRNRSLVLVPEDQLSDENGPLVGKDSHGLEIVLIESFWKNRRRPYQKQIFAFHVLNLRHFALEQAEGVIVVRYPTTPQPFRSTLKPLIQELGSLRVMDPAELEGPQDLAPLLNKELITHAMVSFERKPGKTNSKHLIHHHK